MKIAAILAVGMIALSASMAKADTITYTLNESNLGNPPYVGPYGTVKVDLTDSTHATITFTGGSGGGFTYIFGAAQAVDVNVNASSFSASVTTPNTTTVNISPPNSAGPYGKLNLQIDNSDGNGDATTPFVFIVTDLSGTWANASSVLTGDKDGYFAAAHIFVRDANGGNPTTGFAGVKTPGNNVPDGGATAALLGMGLLGLRWMRRVTSKKN